MASCLLSNNFREVNHNRSTFTMATILPQHWVVPNTYVAVQSLQSVAFDDVVAMAVLAILSAVYLVRGTLWDRPDPHLYKMYERPQEKMGSKTIAAVSRDVSERMQQMVSNLSVIVSSNVGLPYSKECRYRCFLGFSIRHGRALCRSTCKRDQATLRKDGTRC